MKTGILVRTETPTSSFPSKKNSSKNENTNTLQKLFLVFREHVDKSVGPSYCKCSADCNLHHSLDQKKNLCENTSLYFDFC